MVTPRFWLVNLNSISLDISSPQNSSTTNRASANPHNGIFWWISDRGWDQLSTRTYQWIQDPVHNCDTFYPFRPGDDLGFSKIPCSMAHNSWIQDGWLDHLHRLCKNTVSFCRGIPILTVNQILSWGSFVTIYCGTVPFSTPCLYNGIAYDGRDKMRLGEALDSHHAWANSWAFKGNQRSFLESNHIKLT